MNIIFFGSGEFAVSSLKALLYSQHKILCVVTRPDRKKGRGLHLGATAVKELAGEFRLKVYQPEKINNAQAIKFLKDLKPDLFIVISYGQILSQEVLEIPKIFAINAHASLLPKYRGAAPINWSLINGDTQTGITVIKMTPDMDAGPVMLQKKVDVAEQETALTLTDKLSQAAADSLVEVLPLIENNNYRLQAQDEDKVSFAPKLKKEDGLIDWSRDARGICNLIRGCLVWPGAFTYYKDKLLKIYRAESRRVETHKSRRIYGQIIEVSGEGIIVATGKDDLIIEELQIEGKRRMGAQEFIRGHKLSTGEIFAKK